MSILFLGHRIPFPPDRGDKIRSFHLLKALAALGEVHLACFADDAADAAHLAGLRAELGWALGEVHVEVRRRSRISALASALADGTPVSVEMFASTAMQRAVDGIVSARRIDTIFGFSSQMAQYVPHDWQGRFVMDFVDVDSAKFAGYADAGGFASRLYRREAAKLLSIECQTASRADASLFVSEAEASLFRELSGAKAAQALPNGVDLDHFAPDDPAEPVPGMILFTGQMDYRPNVEAVTAFARVALPRIRSRMPSAHFVIAGRNPDPSVRALAGEGVTVTGAVADMREWLRQAEVVVAPLGIARGVQNKVLEAMAMGRAVVASPAAFEGIDAEAGRDLIVAADPAEAVIALLTDPNRRDALGRAARRAVEARYHWDSCLAPLAELVGRAPALAAA
ncbi:TIGR03087 family PEP-CTERM/XrtA system glycosyltransferase [Allosphingosinicella indica]|nr:TIGR03087 family PEP-CTERM/XrtA system glycosyltransferase [Allosphingosinicella indica]